jgi:hypothetical protein
VRQVIVPGLLLPIITLPPSLVRKRRGSSAEGHACHLGSASGAAERARERHAVASGSPRLGGFERGARAQDLRAISSRPAGACAATRSELARALEQAIDVSRAA